MSFENLVFEGGGVLVENGRKATSAYLEGLQGDTVPAAATASR